MQENHLYGFNTAVYSAQFPYTSDRILVESTKGFDNFQNAYVPLKNFKREEQFLREFNSITHNYLTDSNPIEVLKNVPNLEGTSIKTYYLDNSFYDEIHMPKQYICIIVNTENDTYFIWHYDSFLLSSLSVSNQALNIPMKIKITDGWPALEGRCDLTFAVDKYYTKVYLFDKDHPFRDYSNMSIYCKTSYDEAQLLTDDENAESLGVCQNVFRIEPVFQGFKVDLRNTVRSRLLDRTGNILHEVADRVSESKEQHL